MFIYFCEIFLSSSFDSFSRLAIRDLRILNNLSFSISSGVFGLSIPTPAFLIYEPVVLLLTEPSFDCLMIFAIALLILFTSIVLEDISSGKRLENSSKTFLLASSRDRLLYF